MYAVKANLNSSPYTTAR